MFISVWIAKWYNLLEQHHVNLNLISLISVPKCLLTTHPDTELSVTLLLPFVDGYKMKACVVVDNHDVAAAAVAVIFYYENVSQRNIADTGIEKGCGIYSKQIQQQI